jgi:hypothetical protein
MTDWHSLINSLHLTTHTINATINHNKTLLKCERNITARCRLFNENKRKKAHIEALQGLIKTLRQELNNEQIRINRIIRTKENICLRD